MKNLIYHPLRWSILVAVACISSGYALAADTNSAPAVPPSAPDSNAAARADSAKLPYGVADVVKLSRSQVSEDVIMSYVLNSGIAYSLGSDDIVRLRNDGVSDRVVNAMLGQHNKAVQAAQLAAAAPAPVSSDNVAPPAVSETQSVPDSDTAPAVEAPLTPPASSTYVIPYPPATAPYYGYPSYYYPYYPYYYGGYYGGPIVSFSFGFGGGHGHFHHHH